MVFKKHYLNMTSAEFIAGNLYVLLLVYNNVIKWGRHPCTLVQCNYIIKMTIKFLHPKMY